MTAPAVTKIDRPLLARLLSGKEHGLASLTSAAWEQLVHLSKVEGVAPLLYWTLSQSVKIDLIPQKSRLALRAMYTSVKMNNEQVIRELETLLSLFDQADIGVVALKGACFALTIYPDPGLRPMMDLDLLVPASRVSAALEIAKASGYVVTYPEASPGLNDLLSHAICLKKMTAPFLTLEIHTTLVAEESYRHAVPVGWFWSQTEQIGGNFATHRFDKLLMLTPTAQVLYACAHAMLQHGGRNTSLRWLCDLDFLLRVYAACLDWELLVSQARNFEWGSAVSAALSQVVEYFDSPVPQPVLEHLVQETDRNADRVAAMQRPPATHTMEEYQKIKSLNWQGRFRLVLALGVPSPAYMRWRYGLKSWWALPGWYVFRWWGIISDGTRTIWMLGKSAKTN